MEKNVLIIDDSKDQAEGLCKALTKALPRYTFESRHEEQAIIEAVENRFYSLAIVDIRMDKYRIDGIQVVNRIFEVNPFAKVIIVSAFKDEYFSKLKKLFLTGKVLDIVDKEEFAIWIPKLAGAIDEYYDDLERNPSQVNSALLQFYAEAKNETDTYKKGERFEHFISLLFQSFGYREVMKRVIDKSRNEVDLVIRNEIDDYFLDKFGKYILVECKNKPEDGVSKNDFIVFNNKLKHTHGLSDLGIIATTGYISRTTYLEAMRESGDLRKVLFMDNLEIEKIINAEDKLESFKKLIDLQIKDN